MISKLWKLLMYGSRWIAIVNGFILVAVGITLVILGEPVIYLSFTVLGIFALYVGMWRPEYWSKKPTTVSGEK